MAMMRHSVEHGGMPHATLESLFEGQRRIEAALWTLQQGVDELPQKLQHLQHGPGPNDAVGVDGDTSLADSETAEIPCESAAAPAVSAATGASTNQIAPARSPFYFLEIRTGHVAHAPLVECARQLETSLTECAQSWKEAEGDAVDHAGSLAPTSGMVGPTTVRVPFHPTAWPPTIFECLSMFFVLADFIIIPVTVAWDVAVQGWLLSWAILALSFWVSGIALKFCTGFVEDASVIQRWQPIIKRYLRRGFAFDLGLVLLEVADLVRAASNSSAATWRVTRLFRLAKLVRMLHRSTRLTGSHLPLLRVLMVRLTRRWHGKLPNLAFYINLASVLVNLALTILGLSHILACGWYYLLRTSEEDFGKGRHGQYAELLENDVQTYTLAVYWAITTMLGGASFLSPVLWWEMIYSTVTVLVGALIVTSITSTLSALLVEVQLTWVETKKRLANLTSFMERQGTPGSVIMVVLDDFSQRMASARAHLSEEHVESELSMLSANLRVALREQQYRHSFLRVRVFRLVYQLQPAMIQELCGLSQFKSIEEGHEVFETAQDMPQAMLLSEGQADYHLPRHRRDSLRSAELTQALVHGPTWVCEAALLLVWRTVGRMVTKSSCDFLIVSADTFVRTISMAPETLAVVSAYCTHFLASMVSHNEAHEGSAVSRSSSSIAAKRKTTDISLAIDGDILVAEMPALVRQKLVSEPALEVLKKQMHTLTKFFNEGALSNLEQEISQGRCHLMTAQDGQILRVVRMVVLQVTDERDRLCARLAREVKSTSASADFEVNFGLLGHKLEDSQTPVVMAEAMLEDAFGDWASEVDVLGADDEPIIEYQKSNSFGIVTKYVKTVVHVAVRGVIVGPSLAQIQAARQHQTLAMGSSSSIAEGHLASVVALGRKEKGRILCQFLERDDFDRYANNKEATMANWKARLAHMSPQQLDAISNWQIVNRLQGSPVVVLPV